MLLPALERLGRLIHRQCRPQRTYRIEVVSLFGTFIIGDQTRRMTQQESADNDAL